LRRFFSPPRRRNPKRPVADSATPTRVPLEAFFRAPVIGKPALSPEDATSPSSSTRRRVMGNLPSSI
jgi:hypothetical protein